MRKIVDKDPMGLYGRVILNEGAYFFRKGGNNVDDGCIASVFEQVMKENTKQPLTRVVRKLEQINAEVRTALCSLLIFEKKSNPSFLNYDKYSCPDTLLEKKFGYLLIVEIDEYVVIIKKNVSHMVPFINSLQVIKADDLCGTLADHNSIFQSLSVTNMNMNENAMRNKSYEANDLANTMSTYGAGHTIVTKAKFSDDESVYTLNINTSRFEKFGKKKNLPDILHWLAKIVDRLNRAERKQSFLSRFAKPISWNRAYGRLTPSSLLINIFELRNYIEKLNDNQIYLENKESRYIDVTGKISKIIGHGVDLLELEGCSDNEYRIFKDKRNNVGIHANKNNLKLTIFKALKALYYKGDDGQYYSIEELINTLHCYSVGFEDSSYVYYGGHLYENARILEELDPILSVFEVFDEINSETTEKGGHNVCSTDFEKDSMFHIVENNIFKDAECLICDDMGDEWADHIAIEKRTISFIHSKCSTTTGLSASAFHEIIAQATKNLGNLNPVDSLLDDKKKKIDDYWKDTQIKRCRKGTSDEFIDKFKKLKTNPNLTKEVCLAINFISKRQLEDAFIKLKNGEPFQQKRSATQMVWLLNGFISACKECDAHCRIFCGP